MRRKSRRIRYWHVGTVRAAELAHSRAHICGALVAGGEYKQRPRQALAEECAPPDADDAALLAAAHAASKRVSPDDAVLVSDRRREAAALPNDDQTKNRINNSTRKHNKESGRAGGVR